ncbi:MAG: hypothetical protein ACPKPY_08250 [Nitrososphaeraceae archaeon]
MIPATLLANIQSYAVRYGIVSYVYYYDDRYNSLYNAEYVCEEHYYPLKDKE